MGGKKWDTLNARWGKRMLSNKCGLPGDLGFPANWGQDLALIASTTEISLHRRRPQWRQRGSQQSLFWCCKVTCSPTKPKPGAQRTKGWELPGGTDLSATADFAQPHLLAHLTKQSFHIQGCRNRDREASWLGPNATPYQAVGPSAQKRRHKNGKCPPHLEVQRALWKAGINESSTYGIAEQLSWLSPWESQSLLAAERHHFQQNAIFPWCRAHPTDTCKAVPRGSLSRWTTPQCGCCVCVYTHFQHLL